MKNLKFLEVGHVIIAIGERTATAMYQFPHTTGILRTQYEVWGERPLAIHAPRAFCFRGLSGWRWSWHRAALALVEREAARS